ncbi:MAG TPA: glycosyltransferase family 1 protein [Bacillota bacterium]|nr:glycosyltransferase family 1 protein [Bacillota bacterium]
MSTRHIVIDARNRRSSTGRYTDRLVEHLQDIDHDNRYTILVQPDDPWEMHSPAFTTLPCPFPQFSFNPLDQIRFARQLYQLHPDLVHFTMTQQPLLYFGNIVTTTHDLLMFYFVRRGDTPAAVYWVKMRLYHFLMWWSHKKSARVIVPTNYVAKELATMQPFTKGKLVVTYESGALPSTKPPVKPKGAPQDFIMYLGNAFPHKNVYRLCQAFDLLHTQHPNLHLMLVGKKEKHYEELEQQVKTLSARDNIHITGFLPDEQAAWLYQHTKLFVTVSLGEGWGLPGTEAMANGAPVLASNVSVMPEVYGDAAAYCDPNDPADIAHQISKLLDDDKQRADLVKNGYQQIKKYSWTKMAQETLIVYKKLLG